MSKAEPSSLARPNRGLSDELQESTLALQHFYEVRRVRARDVYGTLYEATAQPFARPVWLWVLDRAVDMGLSLATLETFEAALSKRAQPHAPAALRTLDAGHVGSGVPFAVLDAVEGRDLASHLALHGALGEWQTLRVVEQLAAALQDARDAGIERSGLDLERVILSDPERATVHCFGLGVALTREQLLRLPQAITQHALMRPLPPHEFARDVEFSATSEADDGSATSPSVEPPSPVDADVYALAAIAYACLSGRHPYFRDDRELGDGVLTMLREGAPSLLGAGVAEALDELLRASLGQGKAPTSVANFAAALRAAVSDESRRQADEAARSRWAAPATLGSLPSASKPSRRLATSTKLLLAVCAVLVLSNGYSAFEALRTPVTALIPVPDFVPPADDGEGVDVVVHSYLVDGNGRTRAVAADVYVVGRHGETQRIARTPCLLRNQQEEAKLRFVLAGNGVAAKQIDLRVEDQGGGSMIVGAEVERQLSRSAALTGGGFDPTELM